MEKVFDVILVFLWGGEGGKPCVSGGCFLWQEGGRKEGVRGGAGAAGSQKSRIS